MQEASKQHADGVRLDARMVILCVQMELLVRFWAKKRFEAPIACAMELAFRISGLRPRVPGASVSLCR